MGGGAALQLVRDAGLTGLVRAGSEHTAGGPAGDRLLPVLPELRPLLPGGGLRRGATVGIATTATTGATATAATANTAATTGATSLLLAALAEASRAGSWCAVVGLPTLGLGAAVELGLALDRLVLVPNPGPEWPTAVAALLDGFDIVAVAAPGGTAPGLATRLAARARQRGAVLVPYGPWPATDVTLQAVDPVWHGTGEDGRGRLRGRQLTVVARGRGAAAASRVTHLWLPRPTGLLADLAYPITDDGRVIDPGPLGTLPRHPAAEAPEGAGLAEVVPLRRPLAG